MTTNTQGPEWTLTDEYPSLTSKEFQNDLRLAGEAIAQAKDLGRQLESWVPNVEALTAQTAEACLALICKCFEVELGAATLLSNMSTYVQCLLSVDGQHSDARNLHGQIQAQYADLAEALAPLEQILLRAPQGVLAALLQQPEAQPRKFQLEFDRWYTPHLLPLGEEALITRLQLHGKTAWGNLYNTISSSLVCTPQIGHTTEPMGIARAASLLSHPEGATRKAAFVAIQDAWRAQQDTCASILNALAGWRNDLAHKRSTKAELGVMDGSLKSARIQRSTLDALMIAVDEAGEGVRRSLRRKAKTMGTERLGPWDLMAPYPGTTATQLTSFDDAMDQIEAAFAGVHPDMGNFVRMMRTKGWIEGRVQNGKRPGAYCTNFPKSRSPRVYMTFEGSSKDVGTLAHEIGHAFHSWIMRDMPLPKTRYPMTLAETASIFAETLVDDATSRHAKSDGERKAVLWEQATSAAAFLLNIPARLHFELNFYDQRRNSPLGPDQLCAMMNEAWKTSYQDTLSEYDPLFWCSKLHFHLAGVSFYNFPYTFGYLFSLGVYAQRAKLGGDFYGAYTALLRDTGSMTAEDLAVRHLGADLTKPEFWRSAVQIVNTQLQNFEEAIP